MINAKTTAPKSKTKTLKKKSKKFGCWSSVFTCQGIHGSAASRVPWELQWKRFHGILQGRPSAGNACILHEWNHPHSDQQFDLQEWSIRLHDWNSLKFSLCECKWCTFIVDFHAYQILASTFQQPSRYLYHMT